MLDIQEQLVPNFQIIKLHLLWLKAFGDQHTAREEVKEISSISNMLLETLHYHIPSCIPGWSKKPPSIYTYKYMYIGIES